MGHLASGFHGKRIQLLNGSMGNDAEMNNVILYLTAETTQICLSQDRFSTWKNKPINSKYGIASDRNSNRNVDVFSD